eukprot:742715-Pelagomonas_calceolata.AAC.1
MQHNVKKVDDERKNGCWIMCNMMVNEAHVNSHRQCDDTSSALTMQTSSFHSSLGLWFTDRNSTKAARG